MGIIDNNIKLLTKDNVVEVNEFRNKLSKDNLSSDEAETLQYYINNIPGAENDCKARKTIAEKIVKIAHKLPDGYYLLVWDSFRTIKTQQALFDSYYEEFKKENYSI